MCACLEAEMHTDRCRLTDGFLLRQVAFRRLASRTARMVKATSLHFATQHGWQTI